jgi:hypothetical protein
LEQRRRGGADIEWGARQGLTHPLFSSA